MARDMLVRTLKFRASCKQRNKFDEYLHSEGGGGEAAASLGGVNVHLMQISEVLVYLYVILVSTDCSNPFETSISQW